MSQHKRSVTILALGLLLATACGSTLETTRFTNPDFDFSFVERVAVLPFDNLSGDRQAGHRAARITVTALLATGAVDVVEIGEVEAALVRLGVQPQRAVVLSSDQVVALGREVGAQAVLAGTVTESSNHRSGAVSMPVVTIDLHLIETETGVTVWAVTRTEKGSTFSARVLGAGGEAISDTTRRCVGELLETLIQ